MLYVIAIAVVAFTVGLQVLANREMRYREARQFARDSRVRKTPR